MKTIEIKPELLAVLRSFTQQQFTVDQLTTAYLESKACKHSNKKSARQFVYRNMVRMMKAELMSREIKEGGWPTYLLTKRFNESTDNKKSSPKVSTDKQRQYRKQDSLEKPCVTTAIRELSERLSQHRSDMLCAVEEAEEYHALCTAHPGLKIQTQELYNRARERSAILLGKIKALETLISIKAPEQC